MKYYIATTFLLAAFSLLMTQRKPAVDPAVAAHLEWKRTAVEPQALARPAIHDSMRWDSGVEVRSPASNEKKSKKK